MSLTSREREFENRYFHDQELRFRIQARRDKLLGLWAAEKLGKTGEDANSYAQEVIKADFQRSGDGDVFHKIRRDFDSHGVEQSDHQVRRRMDEFLVEAEAQIRAE